MTTWVGLWSRRAGGALAIIALGTLLPGCDLFGGAHDASVTLGSYFAHHSTDFGSETAERIDAARELYGEDGTAIVCFIAQNSKVSTSGDVTLPSESDVETGVEDEILGKAPEQAAYDDIYQIAQDYTSGQLAKASLDAGCDIKGVSEDF